MVAVNTSPTNVSAPAQSIPPDPAVSSAQPAPPVPTVQPLPAPPLQQTTGFQPASGPAPVALNPPPTPATAYPREIYAGWDPKTGAPIRGLGWGRISQDPANPHKDLCGPEGARTGAKFFESRPNQFVKNILQPGSQSLGTLGAPFTAPQKYLLTDSTERVVDLRKFGSEADVARALTNSATPEEYAAALDKMGGYVSGAGGHNGAGVYHPFGITKAVDGTFPLTAPRFALGSYPEVHTYLAANPDVQELAKLHPSLHPHVVAEWHFARQGHAEGRPWPKEVTKLPRPWSVVGGQSSADNPFAVGLYQGYLDRNPDVVALAKKFGMNEFEFAVRHYAAVGSIEGRVLGPMNYNGKQNDPDFESYYTGKMTRSEERSFWDPPQANRAAGDSQPVESREARAPRAKLSPALAKMLKSLPAALRARLRALPPELLQALLEELSAMDKAKQNLAAVVESFLDLHLEDMVTSGE